MMATDFARNSREMSGRGAPSWLPKKADDTSAITSVSTQAGTVGFVIQELRQAFVSPTLRVEQLGLRALGDEIVLGHVPRHVTCELERALRLAQNSGIF